MFLFLSDGGQKVSAYENAYDKWVREQKDKRLKGYTEHIKSGSLSLQPYTDCELAERGMCATPARFCIHCCYNPNGRGNWGFNCGNTEDGIDSWMKRRGDKLDKGELDWDTGNEDLGVVRIR